MQSRLEEIDSLWDQSKNLKENITHLFSTDLLSYKSMFKSTGFYNSSYKVEQKNYQLAKKGILDLLQQDELSLEEFYKKLLYVKNQEASSPKEMSSKVDYAIQKVEESEPELKTMRQAFETEIEEEINIRKLWANR